MLLLDNLKLKVSLKYYNHKTSLWKHLANS